MLAHLGHYRAFVGLEYPCVAMKSESKVYISSFSNSVQMVANAGMKGDLVLML